MDAGSYIALLFMRYTQAGSLVFTKTWGDCTTDELCSKQGLALSMAIDASDNAYIAGKLQTAFFNTGMVGGKTDPSDAFLAKISSSTGALVYGNAFGTAADD